MQTITQTGPRGKVVAANATRLTQALGQGETAMYLEADIFTDNDVVTVGEEDIKITSHGTTCTVARAQNGTADTDHQSGANVRSAAGEELLSKTFDGAANLSALRAGGEVEAAFAIQVDGTVKYLEATSPYQLAAFFPMTTWQPPDGTVIKLLVWTWQEATFWAEMQS